MSASRHRMRATTAAAGAGRDDVGLGQHVGHGARLQALDGGHERERERRGGHDQVAPTIPEACPPASAAGAVHRRHAAGREPAGARRHEHEQQRTDQRRERQQQDRQGPDGVRQDVAAAARDHPERQADERGGQRGRRTASTAVLPARSATRPATGRPYISDVPKSRRTARPSQSANCAAAGRSRPRRARSAAMDAVEAPVADQLRGDVARGQPRQDQRRRRHHDDEQHREGEPPGEESQHRPQYTRSTPLAGRP